MSERQFSRPALSWACYLAMFVFGIDLAVLGAILPALFRRIELDPSEAGSLFIFLNGGSLLVALFSGPAFDRFGYKVLLTIASVIGAAALIGMGMAHDYWTLIWCSILLGLGAGGLNSGSNAFIADLYPEGPAAALNRLGAFFGVGALFIPLLIGSLLTFLTLDVILPITAVIVLIPGTLFLLLRFPPGKFSGRSFPFRDAFRLLTNPVVLLLGILLFFQSGNEMTLNAFAATHLVQTLDLSVAQAPLYMACLWGCVMVGRLLSPRLLRTMKETTLVQIGAGGACLGVAAFALFPNPLFSALAIGFSGLAFSPIFPCVFGYAARNYPNLSATVLGVLMSMALVGGMFLPWIAGQTVESRSTTAGLLVASFGFAMVLVLQTVVKLRKS